MSGDLAHAQAEMARRIRDRIDQSFAEWLQLEKPQDPGPLTSEKFEQMCGIVRKRTHKFRFSKEALSFRLPFANYINIGTVS